MKKQKKKQKKPIVGKSNIKEPKMDAPEIKGSKIDTKKLDEMVKKRF